MITKTNKVGAAFLLVSIPMMIVSFVMQKLALGFPPGSITSAVASGFFITAIFGLYIGYLACQK